MLYLFCCFVVMLITVKEMLDLISGNFAFITGKNNVQPSPWTTMIGMAMCIAYMLPLILTFKMSIQMASEQGLPSDDNRSMAWGLLVGAALVLTYALRRWRLTLEDERKGFWSIGRTLILGLAVVVGAMTSLSHLTFYRSAKDGFANVGILKQMGLIKDMDNCPGEIAFVHFNTGSGPLSYRCPTSIVFGSHSSQPLAPWPDYVTGQSQDLADAAKKLMDSAKKPGEPE